MTHVGAIREATVQRHTYGDDDSDLTSVTWKSRAAVALLGLFGMGSLRRPRANIDDEDADSNESHREDDDSDDSDGQAMSQRLLDDAHRGRQDDRNAKRIERNRRALRDCGLD
ncbi:hypothetical protein pneo_cds_119 [Pandoravirus neocaledonia]|uniref:Uncharacterized protein n=1 Tax=Pandoravirus neocaledonia TaxID=2107708 RepID=A0A2U7UBC2_9VIRU|nr:hypothetical protein pneo_cds_119 [Pandoravirus neocaledonia]AVK75726.1 hypothetical protein pneo_cds_119 [Pandoravirus neocaledonia]